MRCSKLFLSTFIVVFTLSAGLALAAEPPFAILGKKPAHVVLTSTPPNAQAVTKAIWMPGIDDGYVPQGLTVADSSVLVVGYQSTSTAVGSGPCRVFRLDPASGKTTGYFDMPASSKHAGGMAYLGKGILVVGDTRRLYKISMKRAFADGNTGNAMQAELKLAGALKASSLAFDGKNLFLCSYSKKAEESQGWYLPLSLFNNKDAADVGVTESAAVHTFAVPTASQGAAFDKSGQLWMTQSGSRFGTLQRLDPKTGTVAASYEMVIGIEDISFDKNGRIWAVSEAGSIRWSRWTATFPVVFAMDTAKLAPSAP